MRSEDPETTPVTRVVVDPTLRGGSARPEPVDMERDETRLAIRWKDGHRSVWTFDDLRRACPCATCRTEREERAAATSALRVLPASAPTHAVLAGVQWVGWYAFRFAWADGHDTGIYAFEYLRSMCGCEECAGAGASGKTEGQG